MPKKEGYLLRNIGKLNLELLVVEVRNKEFKSGATLVFRHRAMLPASSTTKAHVGRTTK
jgi:hypothetical protein